MEIKVEDVSSVKKKVVLLVEAEKVKEKMEEFFGMVQKKAKADGFRQGRVPSFILRSKYLNEARKVVSKSLIAESYETLLKDYEIVPIGNPHIEERDGVFGEFAGDESFSASIELEVLPKIEVAGYKDVKIDEEPVNVKELYERKLEDLREQFAEKTQIEGPAEVGDNVVIDFKGFLNGMEFNGGSAEGHSIDKLGQGTLVPGFEEAITGMKAGEEKRIKIKFADDYPADFLKGQETEFDVKVNTIVRSKKSEINEDLALMYGVESIEAMCNDLMGQAEKEAKQTFQNKVGAKIVNELVEKNDFEMPSALVGGEIERLEKQYKGADKEVLRKQAMWNCKRSIILDAVYGKENIQLDPAELDAYLEEQAQRMNQTKDGLVSLLNNTNQMETFLSVLRTQKVIEYLVDINMKGDKNE